MKAAVCHIFDQPLVIEEIGIDPPQAGEIRVKLSACAICHSDIIYISGVWGGDLPMIFGHEASGVVEQIGAGVNNAKVGDHVIVTLIRSCGHCRICESGQPYLYDTKFPLDRETRLHGPSGTDIKAGLRTGAFAEYVVVDQSQVVAIPSDIPLDSACLLSCGVITGLGAVTNAAKVTAGNNVAVIGCGGVGLNSVQGAAMSGAFPIAAIDLIDEKLRNATIFGATHTINAREVDAKQASLELTDGRGFDFVFMTAGSPRAIEQGIDILSRSGTLVLVGMPPPGDNPDIDPTEIANNGQRIMGTKMGSTRLRVDIPRLIYLYQQGRLKLDELITNRYPLEQINEAITEVKADKALRNVIVF
ncbi:MAG: Zn-dependent alcohol dehydrogenase [Gammaproteobacteria bacterium]|nr:Zn-dependent alcohol dehydrogenase [Gammaproteobacteria bacterium]